MPPIVRFRPARARGPSLGLARHFEGWQPALLAVFFAGSVAMLVVPQPVEPTDVPLPRADIQALRRVDAADEARARAAEREHLDVDVRDLGSEVRAYGRADYEGDPSELLLVRQRVVAAAARALELGDEPLLRLRAYQMRLFERAVRGWVATGKESDDLRELGGAFVAMLRRSGWWDAHAHELLVDAHALRVMFKRRWNEVAGIPRGHLEPTLDEERALYAFFLRFPMGSPAAFAEPDGPTAALARRAYQDEYRLKKIDELAQLDPSYPRTLARGIIHYRQARFELAAKEFDEHLEAAPDGPMTLRVHNYLRAAIGRAKAEAF